MAIWASSLYADAIVDAQILASNDIIVDKWANVEFYRVNDTILRQEVIGIAIKLKWVNLPNGYQCQNYYIDVSLNNPNTWACRAAEISADEGIITRSNNNFRPEDQITRYESLAMVSDAVCALRWTQEDLDLFYELHAPNGNPFRDGGSSGNWIHKLLAKMTLMGVLEQGFRNGDQYNEATYASERQPATRWEVFGYARSLMDFKDKNGGCDGNPDNNTVDDALSELEEFLNSILEG